MLNKYARTRAWKNNKYRIDEFMWCLSPIVGRKYCSMLFESIGTDERSRHIKLKQTEKLLTHTEFIIQFALANLPKTTTTPNSDIYFTISLRVSLSLYLFLLLFLPLPFLVSVIWSNCNQKAVKSETLKMFYKITNAHLFRSITSPHTHTARGVRWIT